MLNIICVGAFVVIYSKADKYVVTKSSDFELNSSGNTGLES